MTYVPGSSNSLENAVNNLYIFHLTLLFKIFLSLIIFHPWDHDLFKLGIICNHIYTFNLSLY